MEQLHLGGPAPEQTSTDLTRAAMPYDDRLKLRPWENPAAQLRLNVPLRLLPGHCPVQTNWIVLTGAPCAGKTTVASKLAKLGCQVVYEVSRGYVEAEQAKGRKVSEIRADEYAFRQHVFCLTRDTEVSMLPRAHELIFFDRSAVDSISWHRASGLNPHEILRQIATYRYRDVFHFTALPFEDDGLRTANEERRVFLDAALERDYRALAYRPVRIPYASVEERVRMLLEHCGCS